MDPLRPFLLTCEHLENPLGLDERSPRLCWILEGDGRGRRQSAFEIRVAEDPASLAGTDRLSWCSGRVASAETRDITYAGVPLQPRTRYHWTVLVWDEVGRASAPAAPARFETGLLDEPWGADWLTGPAAPRRFRPDESDKAYVNPHRARAVAHLRRSFRVDRPVVRARLYATALGVYEARLNGEATGDALLSPGWTDYAKRLDYQVYDVTALVRQGPNVLGALLGEGWYSGYLGFYPHRPRHIYGTEPQFRARLVLDFADGTSVSVATDASWRVGRGPRVYSDLLKGELFDARLAAPGWDAPGFDDADWTPAGTGAGTEALLRASRAPPVRVTRTLVPTAVTRAPDGSHVVDMGQNMVGRVRITLPALQAGAVVTLQHAEMLTPEGALYRANLRAAAAEDRYVSDGAAAVFTPLFTVHGFRYIGVTGLDDAPALDAITGEVIGSDLDETSEWETSNPTLDRLRENVLWSQRGNFLSIPTDCPQRDERLGWMADVGVFLPTAAYAMDLQGFMAKWIDDVLDAQSSEGAFPDVAPRGPHGPDGGPAWGDAGVIVPMTLYRRYGDRRLLERCFSAMRAWTDFVSRHNPDRIRTKKCGWNFGDWLSAGETTSKPLVATAYHALIATLTAEAAEVLGRPEDAARYHALFGEVRAAFQAKFLTPAGRLEGDTQTAYLLALSIGLLPDDRIGAAVRHLVSNIERRGTQLSTGFLGVRLILPELTRHGHAELAYRLLLNEGCPSWFYPVTQGATTVWERWDGWTAEKGFQSARMNSFNHYSLGSVGEWLMADMAGIADDGSAYARPRLAPVPGPGIGYCRAGYRSPRGWVRSSWRQRPGVTVYNVELPANTAGTLVLPFPEDARLRRDGSPAEPDRILERNGVRCAGFDLGSGIYGFEVSTG
ncbi:MAG: family 78 glycoside hydrolase catalytic domain [Janthinobacterium lividum]